MGIGVVPSRRECRRLRQLERTLTIIELLAPLRHGATAEDLRQDVCETLGEEYHVRTIFRDVNALVTFGILCRDDGGHRAAARWRCNASSIRAAIHRQVAHLRAEVRDPWPTADSQGGAR